MQVVLFSPGQPGSLQGGVINAFSYGLEGETQMKTSTSSHPLTAPKRCCDVAALVNLLN